MQVFIHNLFTFGLLAMQAEYITHPIISEDAIQFTSYSLDLDLHSRS
jgi:hypothetical protein